MAHKTPLKTVALAPEMEVGQGALEDGEVMTMAILEEQIAELKLEAVTTVEVLNDKLQEEKRRHAHAKKALEEEQAKRKLEGERSKAEEQGLKREVELLRSETRSLRSKLEMCNKDLAESRAECRESQDKVSGLMKELNEERSEVVKYMEMSIAASDNVDAMTEMLSQAEDDSRVYLAEREGDRASIAVMSVLAEGLGAQLLRAHDDMASITVKMQARLEEMSGATLAKMSDMSLTVSRRDEEIIELRAQVASLAGELEGSTSALEDKEKEASALTEELSALSGYLAMTQESLKDVREKSQVPAVTDPPRDALKIARDELEVMRLDLEASREETTSARNELEVMRLDFEASRMEAASVEKLRRDEDSDDRRQMTVSRPAAGRNEHMVHGDGVSNGVESDGREGGDSAGAADELCGGQAGSKLKLDKTLRALLDARSQLEATKGALKEERSQLSVAQEQVKDTRAELRKLRDEIESNQEELGKLRDEIESNQEEPGKLRDGIEMVESEGMQLGEVGGAAAVPPTGARSSESPRQHQGNHFSAGHGPHQSVAEWGNVRHKDAADDAGAASRRGDNPDGVVFALNDVGDSTEEGHGHGSGFVVPLGGVRHVADGSMMGARGRYKELLEHLQALQNQAWEAEERANRTEDALQICNAALKGRESESHVLREVAGGVGSLEMELEQCRRELEECKAGEKARGEREGELRECWMAERRRGDQLMDALEAERARSAAMERRMEEEKEQDGDAGVVRAQLSKARGYIRELSQAGSALEDRFLILQQEKAEAEGVSEELEDRLKSVLENLDDASSELRASRDEVATFKKRLAEAATREEGLKSELDATLERLEETIACAGIAPSNHHAPPLALAHARDPPWPLFPVAGQVILHQNQHRNGLDVAEQVRGATAARHYHTEHPDAHRHHAEHLSANHRRCPPGADHGVAERHDYRKLEGQPDRSPDYWAARAMYQGSVGKETLLRGVGLSTGSNL